MGRGPDLGPAPGRWRSKRRSLEVSRLERITVDPAVSHGQPTIRGLRYPVQLLLKLLSSGMSVDEVLSDYLGLDRDDVLAPLEFGALAAGGHPRHFGA